MQAAMARDADKATAILGEHIMLTFRSIQLIPKDQLNEKLAA